MNTNGSFVIVCWCSQCGVRAPVRLPATATEAEVDAATVGFVCQNCRRWDGVIKPQRPPAQRRDGSTVMERLHRAVGRAITGR